MYYLLCIWIWYRFIQW